MGKIRHKLFPAPYHVLQLLHSFLDCIRHAVDTLCQLAYLILPFHLHMGIILSLCNFCRSPVQLFQRSCQVFAEQIHNDGCKSHHSQDQQTEITDLLF